MERIKELIQKDFLRGKGLKIVVIFGLIGMVLILVSELLPKEGKSVSEKNTTYSADTTVFQKEIERQLEDILTSIQGVGKAKVMVTVKGTEEYIYAEEEKNSENTDDGRHTRQSENKFLVIDNKGEKEALLEKIINPQINGVVIVCEGGDKAGVCESIYKTVSTVLGVPTNRIYVTVLK